MDIIEFKIKNFKGIENLVFKLDSIPHSNVITLVGLNESGKTTILEAINFFNAISNELNALEFPGTIIENFNDIIPISKRDNFNDIIEIEVTMRLSEMDFKLLKTHIYKNTKYKEIKETYVVKYTRKYYYKNSTYEKKSFNWSGVSGKKIKSSKNFHTLQSTDNDTAYAFIQKLWPNILYFPNFLFDFPSRIFLGPAERLSNKQKYYKEIIQDILNSLQNNTIIETHLVGRILSTESNDKRNLDKLLKTMGKKVSEVVFEAWNSIFNKRIKDTQIIIKSGVDEDNECYLEFEIDAPDGIYLINERSLGFRWFFTFLLFTQFRPHRNNSNDRIIFLLDEPASNLHPNAQEQLLKSFEKLKPNTKIIYTTHSHYMINSKWLENTYIVKNEGLDLEDSNDFTPNKTKIVIDSYRNFVTTHPGSTSYFQPVLEVLDYKPSNLELIPNAVFLEGKNDFYFLKYFNDIVLYNKFKINLCPAIGSGTMDSMISLYSGWGKNFLILLDSDKEGLLQKKRYSDKFGKILDNTIYTYEDIDSTLKKCTPEKILELSESLKIINRLDSSATKINKKIFCLSIQEMLINRVVMEFNKETIDKVSKILQFLQNKMLEKTKVY